MSRQNSLGAKGGIIKNFRKILIKNIIVKENIELFFNFTVLTMNSSIMVSL